MRAAGDARRPMVAPVLGGRAASSTVTSAPRRAPSRELLHAALLATAVVIFAWPIALPSGLVAGAVGAILGVLLAERAIARRHRAPVVVALALGLFLVGHLLVGVFEGSTLVAGVLSPVTALHAAELARWGSAGLGAATALRAIAIRHRAALAIEGAVVALAVATTVAAHRDGMIARPLDVSDWFWTQGIDPVVAFLVIGLAGALLVGGVLVYGRSSKRTFAQLLLVLLIGAAFAARMHGTDTEDQQKRGATGGELESKNDQRTGAQGRGGEGKRSENEKREFGGDGLPNNGGGEGKQNRPAAVVVFHKDVAPATGVFYFRHAVFSQFNGNRLVESTRSDVDRDAVRDFPVARRDVPVVPPESDERTLVATDVALLTDHNRLFALTDPVELSPLANPEPARFRRAYHVVSSVMTGDYEALLGSAPGSPEWSDEVWEHYLELPSDARYVALAKELRAQLRADYAADPVAQALSVKQYLEANATYSFKRNYEGEGDPTAAFLFSDEKLGYCVHLSHAAVYLLRALGVPARVSAGYGVPAKNLGGGSSLLIKSGDAHAWAEIYLEGTGWVPVEVTPEKTDVEPQMFQEKDLQQLLGEMARKEGRRSRDAYQGPKIMDAIRAFLAVLPAILAALAAVAYAYKLWRLAAPRVAGAKRRPRVAYRAALDRLSAVGIARGRGEPRERFAKRAAALSPSFVPLTATHVGAALGSREVAEAVGSRQPPPLIELQSRVGREVRARVVWWRWALGLLNPVSWWWSR